MKEKEYNNYIVNNILKYLNIKLVLGIIILSYFIYSDLYMIKNVYSSYTRLLPLAISILLFVFNLITHHKYKALKAVMYNAFLVSIILMMYAKAIIQINSEIFPVVISGAILVYVIVSLDLRTSLINTIIVFFVPILLYIIYINILFDLETKHHIALSNLYPIVVLGFMLNRIQQKLIYNNFKSKLELEIETKKTKELYEKALLSNEELDMKNRAIDEQNHELIAIEEELKQNNEELLTTQEQLKKQKDTLLANNKELKEMHNDYKRILDANSDIIFMIDKTGNFTYFSNQTNYLLGYEPDELIGKYLTIFANSNDVSKFKEKFNELSETNKISPFETIFIHKEGVYVHVEITAKTIKFKDEFVSIGTIRDISERKLAEQTIKEKSNKYKMLTNAIDDFIWMVDLKMQDMYVSPSCYKLTGYTEDEIAEIGIINLHTRASAKILEQTIAKAIVKSDKNYKVTVGLEYLKKNGITVVAEVTGHIVFDDKGKKIAFAGISRLM